MSEINFRKSFPFINTAVFTDNNILLPITDDEEVKYYNLYASFSLVLGNGAPAYTSRYNSYKGYLFVTNYRIVYRPFKLTAYFDSFCITLDNILNIENESYFEIKVTKEYTSNVYINCEDSHVSVFYVALTNAIFEYMTNENRIKMIVMDSLPLYCETVEKKRKDEK
ncbi:hypothetical protein BDAP_000387 [Binucleata daphniae]